MTSQLLLPRISAQLRPFLLGVFRSVLVRLLLRRRSFGPFASAKPRCPQCLLFGDVGDVASTTASTAAKTRLTRLRFFFVLRLWLSAQRRPHFSVSARRIGVSCFHLRFHGHTRRSGWRRRHQMDRRGAHRVFLFEYRIC